MSPAALPHEIVCVDCVFRAATRIERDGDCVVDAVCERCHGWRSPLNSAAPGTFVGPNGARFVLHKGIYDAELP
jgi:cytochrome c5